eukprot:NODE_681_length_4794_cov_0.887114.p3 type:complete len:278 gc:universal NODE_681_length_4794_cov_0.887114:3592-2759(-)
MTHFQAIEEAAKYIQSQISLKPKLMIICGSGLGPLANDLKETQILHYKDIPHYPSTTILGHVGQLVVGKLNRVPTVCALGRFHFYEGNSMDVVTFPVRVAHAIGILTMIVTNAAGGLNSNFKVGNIMQITDHVAFPCMAGQNPLRGENHPSGPRFVPMSTAYHPELIQKCDQIIEKLNYQTYFKKGVYCMISGPNYETPAECKFLRLLGDAVGMSTAPEVIVANHCGIKVLGFSIITNVVVDQNVESEKEMHADVVTQAAKHVVKLSHLISELVPHL